MSSLDEEKAEAFSNRYIELLNGSAMILMTSLGHQTGLFDVMANLPSSTSDEIASKADLNERYVREWLGAMVTGKFVNYDPNAKTYYLPPEHSAILTRSVSPDNLAVSSQWIPLLGSVESKIIDAFKNGGGVPYSEFKKFHKVMAEESLQTVVSALHEHILPLVPNGIKILDEGIDVLDIGCGSGYALFEMAKTYPNSKFSGLDISEEAITKAQTLTKKEGLSNLKFEIKDISNLNIIENFDLITAFDVIHDQRAPNKVLKEIYGALKADGTFLMQDISGTSYLEKDVDHILGPLLYATSTMHCMTVSLSQGGEGLGTMWGVKTAEEYIKNAGFSSIIVNELEHDPMNVFFVISK
ncbi:MAG: Ubiquinone biosynthesis O-methyltransferase [Candidatus Heimdallarchaeota archaeon LC_3]|nr:MAG: Ubiquinone biosynthesis O-methyltransferase [Candidatus Heimdallarchaeota archaeon LC_3]